MRSQQWDELELVNNTTEPKKRFEMNVDGQIAVIEYILTNQGIIYLTHTEVPKELEGKGVASAVVAKTLVYIRENNLKMAPLCPFVAAYLKRNPGAADDIMAPGYSIS